MSKTAFHIVRVGLGITFVWIGILIIKDPQSWGGYLQPWAVRLLPAGIEQIMVGTAIFDIAVGVLLLIDSFTWVAALLGALHLTSVLAVSGITDITIRDIGLLAAAAAVMIDAIPFKVKSLFQKVNTSSINLQNYE